MFGSNAQTANTQPLFGAASTASTTSTSLFGAKPAAASTPMFGATSTPAAAPSLFGATASAPSAAPSLFGSNAAPAATSSNLFGTASTTAVAPLTLGAAPATSTPFGVQAASTTGTTPLFGNKPPATATTSSLFGNAASSTSSAPSLFGSTTAPASTTSSLFGTAAKPAGGMFSSTSTASTGLFGAPPQQGIDGGVGITQPQKTPTPFLLANQAKPQAATTSSTLFGTPTTTAVAPLTLGAAPATSKPFGVQTASTTGTTPLFGTKPPATTTTSSLFGNATSSNASAPSLFGSTAAPATTTSSLFGTPAKPAGGMFGSASTPSTGLFGTPAAGASLFGAPQQKGVEKASFLDGGVGTTQRQKTSLTDTEVPAPLIAFLEQIKSALKKNNEIAADFSAAFESLSDEFDAKFVKSKQSIHVDQRRNRNGNSEVEGRHLLSNARVVGRISEESRTNPAAGFQNLVGYLEMSAENLKDELEEERQRIVSLEGPLKEYLNVKEGVTVAKGINKKELYNHVHRTMAISDDVLLKATNLHEQLEMCKEQYVEGLRRLHGRYVSSPFEEDQQMEDFEYDPNKRIRGPNIFPSSVTLMNLAEGLPKSGLPTAQPAPGLSAFGSGATSFMAKPAAGLGAFGSSGTSGSLFGAKPAAVNAPSFFGSTPASTAAPASSTSLFKPAFATPTTSLFGSTAASSAPAAFATTHSSSSGTLFGASAKPVFGTGKRHCLGSSP